MRRQGDAIWEVSGEVDRIMWTVALFSETVVACDMGKKFVSVTLDLDEETLTMLEQASAKRGSTVSQMAHELISRALHELMPSRDDALRTVGETIQALSDKGHLIDQLLALTGKATEGKREPVDDADGLLSS